MHFPFMVVSDVYIEGRAVPMSWKELRIEYIRFLPLISFLPCLIYTTTSFFLDLLLSYSSNNHIYSKMKSLTALLALASNAAATGVLLPLYLYPSNNFDDGALRWKPAFDAIEANPSVEWQVVINPHNGPGLSMNPGDDDANYIFGTAKFNSYSNVKTIGYVRTNNGRADAAEVKANITAWKNWDTLTTSDISVKGIFFDEAIEPSGISDGSNYDYLSDVVSFARTTFSPEPIVTVCNFGAKPDEVYYGLCDVVIPFESCLDVAANPTVCTGAPEYQNQTTIDNYIPTTANRPKAAIIVHDFQGAGADGPLLESYIHTLKVNNVGWAYFTSQGYEDGITAPPASVSAVAEYMASA